MAVWILVILAAVAELPAAEVETLKGEKLSGQLAEMSDSVLRLARADAPLDIPLADVLAVRFLKTAADEPVVGDRVVLVDGTRITCSEFTVRKGQAKLTSPQCGTLVVPAARLAQVRFGVSTPKLDEGWAALLTRESKTDMVIVKKEEVLDHLDGVVGDVGEKIGFLLDGDEVPVAREKVYGLIFRRKAESPRPACQVDLAGGDALQAAKVAWNGTEFKVRLAAGPEATLAASVVTGLDFSAGKVKHLSQLEPRDVKYVPYFDLVQEYRRDRSLDGGPLSLAGRKYVRGLALHSKTTLRYRIAGEYTRFTALMGIDDSVHRLGNVRVVISGDGRPLLETDVKGTDAPRPVELDVSGVRDLEFLVDFGADLDIGDHLDLVDAKLLK